MDVKTHAQQIYAALIQGYIANSGRQPGPAELSGFANLAWQAANVFARTPAQ